MTATRGRGRLLALLCGALVLSCAGGCGARAQGQAAEPGASALDGRYQITVVDATLEPRRPDGRPWHMRTPDQALPLLGGLVGLALGSPEVGLAMGTALQGEAEGVPPNPFVELKIGTDTLATLPAGPTLAPSWRYPMAIDARGFAPEERVIVLVRDAYDGGVIARTDLTLSELLGQPALRLYELGSVVTLDLAVEPLPAQPAYAAYRFAVPGDRSAEALREREQQGGRAGSWQRVPVLNGDVVRVTAAGTICPSALDDHLCYDADGAPGRWRSYNYEAFADTAHASLVGVYADIGVEVGTGTSFRAERSGWLMLFVNDTDAGNNRGGFEVVVELNPPPH
ncbi:hypothetical protein [Haliangium ochraceum]|nr:hypothetical protein [Haliangium ochraceum]